MGLLDDLLGPYQGGDFQGTGLSQGAVTALGGLGQFNQFGIPLPSPRTGGIPGGTIFRRFGGTIPGTLGGGTVRSLPPPPPEVNGETTPPPPPPPPPPPTPGYTTGYARTMTPEWEALMAQIRDLMMTRDLGNYLNNLPKGGFGGGQYGPGATSTSMNSGGFGPQGERLRPSRPQRPSRPRQRGRRFLV